MFEQKLRYGATRFAALALKEDVEQAVRAERDANDRVKTIESENVRKQTSREESQRKLEEEIRVLQAR